MRRASFVLICLVAAPAATHAQSAPSTPDGCQRAASDWFTQAYKAAQAAAKAPGGKPPDVRALLAARVDSVKRCVGQFHLATVADSDLLPLASAYAYVGLDSLAEAAVNRRLAAKGLSEAGTASALNMMITVLRKPDTTILARAERYVARLDRLSDSVIAQKILGHANINGEYRYLDVDARIRVHARVIIALGKRLSAIAAARPGAGAGLSPFSVLGAYTDLAEVYGDMGYADSALIVLDQAAADHPELPAATIAQIVGAEHARYELVGKPASALEGAHWINAPPDTHTVDPKGKVSVVEFTAHWCIPCRNSYPGLKSMARTFVPRGVQFIFATQFYGYLGTRLGLDHDAELAADRDYYVGEHGITFPIVVADPPPPRKSASDPFVQEPNEDHYKVGAIPQVVVIDRNGIIRRIVTGWDWGNERRIPVLLTGLLAEKPGAP